MAALEEELALQPQDSMASIFEQRRAQALLRQQAMLAPYQNMFATRAR